MKYSLQICLFIIIPFLGIGQDFQYKRISIGAIDSIELSQGGKEFKYGYPVGVASDYFPQREKYELAQPIVYRKNISNCQFETSYYFSLPDSTLRLIEYWWEDKLNSNTNILQIIKKTTAKIYSYFRNDGKYIPETGDKAAKTIWENDLIYVEQFTISSGLHRVRVLISWK